MPNPRWWQDIRTRVRIARPTTCPHPPSARSRSGDRATAEADFGKTTDRLAAPAAAVGETRADTAAAMVAESGERHDPARELIRSTDKTVDPAAMIRERRLDPTLLTNVSLRYTPCWDVKRRMVSTYIVTPIKSDDGVRIDSPLDLVAAARSEPAANALDVMLLNRAAEAAAGSLRRGCRFILGVPVSAVTLSRPRLRARYLAAWTVLPDALRARIRLVCHHLDGGLTNAALAEIVQAMRQLARAPMLRLSWRANLLPRLGGLGIDTIALDIAEFRDLDWAAIDQRLFSAIARAHGLGIKVFLTGLANREMARKVLTLDVDFLASGDLASLDAVPATPTPTPP